MTSSIHPEINWPLEIATIASLFWESISRSRVKSNEDSKKMFEFENSERIVSPLKISYCHLWPRPTSDDLRRHLKAATVMNLLILFTNFDGCKKYKECFRKKYSKFDYFATCNSTFAKKKHRNIILLGVWVISRGQLF